VQPVVWLVLALWAAFALEKIGLTPPLQFNPRGDVTGVALSLFGHANLSHLTSNTIGIIGLLSLYLIVETDPLVGALVMALVPGLIYWATANPKITVVGISGFVYALAGWWVVHSLATGRVTGFAVVTFALFFLGVFERMNPFQSIPGIAVVLHFWGFVVGAAWAAWSMGLFEQWRV